MCSFVLVLVAHIHPVEPMAFGALGSTELLAEFFHALTRFCDLVRIADCLVEQCGTLWAIKTMGNGLAAAAAGIEDLTAIGEELAPLYHGRNELKGSPCFLADFFYR